MMADTKKRRGAILWAALGGLVLIAAASVLVVASLVRTPVEPGPDPSATSPSSDPTLTATAGPGDVVDPDVSERGWVPEPITRDQDEYARAALTAAGTFDTTLNSRSEWLTWLKTWFTPSPLYDNEQDALDQMARYQTELDQAVVLPLELWNDLASDDGRVTARVDGDLDFLDLPETTAENLWTASADLVLTYTRSTPEGEVSYDETVRVSVQVVCDGESTPTPGSSQQPGDCKVVRFFDEAVG